MNSIIRNILAVIAGIILGGIANMGIIMISGSIIPPPEGVDPSNMESIKANMHLYDARHFIFPFLAHAVGTLVGAFFAGVIAIGRKMTFALVIGFFFLIGGVSMVIMLPSPTWFTILDLAGAYIPMAWIGGKIAIKITNK